MSKYQIWTLNKATDLLDSKVSEIIKQLKRQGHEVRFGDRRRFNKNSDQSVKSKHQLMYERDDVEEYFVPISLKCLGRNGLKSLEAFKNDNPIAEKLYDSISKEPYFKDDIIEKYWKNGIDKHPYMGMNTTKGAGYYEILEQTSKDDSGEEYKNILIGYSQGGLVARYLAALDECIFKNNLIHGIITIGSPNHGSPLANPDNSESVIAGLTATLTYIFLNNKKRKNLINSLNNMKNFNADDIKKIIDGLIEDVNENDSIFKGKLEKVKQVLYSSKKWLSGLTEEGAIFTAFKDLKITDLNSEEYNPLNFVYNNPLQRVKYAAIIHTNVDLEYLIKELLGLFKGLIFDLITRDRRVRRASKNYSEHVMEETALEHYSTAYKLNRLYRDGIRNQVEVTEGVNFKINELDSKNHDFVIPSYSMLLPDNNSGSNFLGNYINKKANHYTGYNNRFNRWRTYRFIKSILYEMC